MNRADRSYCIGRGVAAIRARTSVGRDTDFIAYALAHGLGRLLSRADGSVFPNLSAGDIGAFELEWPHEQERRRAAAILAGLDDKIDLNRRVCKTLERIAKAVFMDWFSGWEADCPISVADLVAAGALTVGDGYRAKNDEMAAVGVPFLRARNVRDGVNVSRADLLGSPGVQRAKDKIAVTGDAFFTSKGTVGRVGRVTRWTPKFIYSPQISFWRALDHETVLADFLYMWFGSEEFLAQRDAVKAQTDMADYVSLQDQRAMKISLPPIDEQRKIAGIVSPLLDRSALARAESQTLAELRDTLLPKLISGEVRVRDDLGKGEAA